MRNPEKKTAKSGSTARKERIKAAAKHLLGTIGAEQMTMRDLARASHVSHATLYNLFGTKDNIISAAVLDNYEQRVRIAIEKSHDSTSPLGQIIFGLQVLNREILREPAFGREMMVAYFKIGNDRQMPEALYRTMYETWLPILKEMASNQTLRRWVSVTLLCEQLCDQAFAISMKWSMRKISNRKLADSLTFATLSVLLGVSTKLQAQEIEGLLGELVGRLNH